MIGLKGQKALIDPQSAFPYIRASRFSFKGGAADVATPTV